MVWRIISILFLTVAAVFVGNSVSAQGDRGHFMNVYDRGATRVFITQEKTLGAALQAEDIQLDAQDTVEPSLDEELIASNYHVNIYRARPVLVVDGVTRIKTVSPFQTADHIAKSVGITLFDGDTTTLTPMNSATDGAGLQLTIIRSVPIILDLYGKKTEVRTQAKTVGGVLKEKNIVLGRDGRVSVPEATSIYSGIEIRVWREGKQTVSVDQEIQFATAIVYDADRPIGYRAVQQKGTVGNRSISYELEIKDGVEISRIEIANIITRNAAAQTEVIGIRNDGSGLTQSRGAQVFTDSKGVSHRETYYDLDMGVVMLSCGQGGYYTVRPDGAKVDGQG
jgi:uncharacterized protein YabE (DUF348 family)